MPDLSKTLIAENQSEPRYSFDVPIPHQNHIEHFQRLYQKTYGVHLPDEEARRQLIALLVVVRYRQHMRLVKELTAKSANNKGTIQPNSHNH